MTCFCSGRNSDVWEIRVRIRVRATRNLRAESRVSSEWPPPADPESRVSPEWPKPQTAESQVSEEKTRDSLVTRRAYSDPIKRPWPPQVCYRSEKWTCRVFLFFLSSAAIEELTISITRHWLRTLNWPFISKNGRMPGGAGRRTSTSFGAINASSATGISNLVR